MSQIRNKAELYQAAAALRRQLCLPERCTSGAVFGRIQSQPGIQIAFLPFQSPALRGMCSPGKPGQEDIILLSSRLTGRERGFYAVHEWLHLCWHRDASKSPFLCGEYRFPQQDSFLEWQANEGAAEILMPWRQVVELVLECPPDPGSRESRPACQPGRGRSKAPGVTARGLTGRDFLRQTALRQKRPGG